MLKDMKKEICKELCDSVDMHSCASKGGLMICTEECCLACLVRHNGEVNHGSICCGIPSKDKLFKFIILRDRYNKEETK
jgi:hypothetical protein